MSAQEQTRTEMIRGFLDAIPDEEIITRVLATLDESERLALVRYGIGRELMQVRREAARIYDGARCRLPSPLRPPSARNAEREDPGERISKGMTQDEAKALGSPVCKMIVHELLAGSCVKCIGTERNRRSPFRDVYDARREITAEREDWTLGHQHNDALRITGKEILRGLWVASQSAPAD